MVNILYLHSQRVLHILQRIPQKRYAILNEGYLESNYQFLFKKLKKKKKIAEKTVPRTNYFIIQGPLPMCIGSSSVELTFC